MEINRQTYEEFFILYIDDELNREEKLAVEDFVKENPDLEHELSLLKDTIIIPDNRIIFEDREILFKQEKPKKLIPPVWYRVAAAAVILLTFAIFGWLYISEKQTISPQAVASVNKPVRPEIEDGKPLKAVPQSIIIADEKTYTEPAVNMKGVTTGSGTKRTSVKENKISENAVLNESSANREATEPALKTVMPETALIENDIDDPEKEIIDVAVSPREIEKKMKALTQSFMQMKNLIEIRT